MAVVKQEGGQSIIVFDLEKLGVEKVNWQRVALNLRSRSTVKDAYVERGSRPNVRQGLLRVYPNLDRIPERQVPAALEALDQAVAETIAHRVANPDRYNAGQQLVAID